MIDGCPLDESLQATHQKRPQQSRPAPKPVETVVFAGRHLPKETAAFLERTPTTLVARRGFVEGMHCDAVIFCNDALFELLLEELVEEARHGTPSCVRQAANAATLPGVVLSLAMPDAHSGYGLPIGGVLAVRLDVPNAVVCPGGVGFDINCGVRLIRTNLTRQHVERRQEKLADLLQAAVPSGVGTVSTVEVDFSELDALMCGGMETLVDRGYAWEEDVLFCEDGGRLPDADPSLLSHFAKTRGKNQLGTLGSGNHYLEVQVVDEIYDETAAAAYGLAKGMVCVMVHCGSRGLGHQVCQDFVDALQKNKDTSVVDKQLNSVPFHSELGKQYVRVMNAAANFAFANRGMITHAVRGVFERVFGRSARDLQMHLVYDVCHNIAKVEQHLVDGEPVDCVVHRKGATRAFPAHHPQTPQAYQEVGQPAIVGGSMGTCSFVLTGTTQNLTVSCGSTCHGAGRKLSRSEAKREVKADAVLKDLEKRGIELRIADPSLASEEADAAYKDVHDVVQTCEQAGLSKTVARLVPLIVVKG